MSAANRLTTRVLFVLATLPIMYVGGRASSAPQVNVLIRWNTAALQGVRDSKLGAPMLARALAVVHTCMYDAWAAYDEKAVGTQLGSALRRPPSERTLANKEQ